MMRVRDLPSNDAAEGRQIVADFFGIGVTKVAIESQIETYSVDLMGNKEAQEKYKQCNPWGNDPKGRPQTYDFSQRILVFWDGKKVQPA